MAAGKVLLDEYIGGALRKVAYWSSDGTGTGELAPYYGQDNGAPVLVASSALAASVTPVCDTAAYANGDVLFTATEIPNALVVAGSVALLAGVRVLDKDDQAAAGLDLYFFSKSTVSMGALNAPATSISDADADSFLGKVSIASTDWEDVGGAKWVNAILTTGKQIPILSEDATKTTSVWVIGVTRGTPTQTASGIVLRPFIVR